MRTCDVDGWEKRRFGRGLCSAHYSAARRAGTLPPPLTVVRGCKVEGCDRKHVARGYCAMHYERLRKQGDPLFVRPTLTPGEREAMRDEADRRRGQIRRAIEDKLAELHLARMLADDDW